MQTEIIFAGFGGQGVLFAGQLLSYSAMEYGREVTWIPSYGPEMRGGTANCSVVISDEEIGSPFVSTPTAVIAMNLPSLDKYEKMVKPGGVVIVNSSLIKRKPTRTDIKVVRLPANEIAEKIGNLRVTNLVMLGALVQALGVIPLEVVEAAIEHHTPERHKRFLPLNLQALRQGAEYKN
jgi:2-oxoglutarate ferredoxin oxidoreductase subunit gamma